jgi:two-component system, NarL family, sensor histidine kinase UhpB
MIKEHVVAVLVPAFRGDELAYIVAAGVPTRRFGDLFVSLNIRPDQTVSLMDRRGIFITRSIKHDEYTGTRSVKPGPPHGPGVVAGVNREGIAFHGFTDYSPPLGWIVSTGVPDRVLEAPMRWAADSFAAASSLLLVIAIGSAYLLGGRISRSIGALGVDRKPTREEFEALFEGAPNGVMVVDQGGRIVLLNRRLEEIFAYAPEELIGQRADALFAPRCRGLLSSLVATASGRQERFGEAPPDLGGLRKDGIEVPVEVSVNPISCGAERLVMMIVIDVSARKLAAERLAATMSERDDLRRRLVRAHERERLRLAHELHDQTGQSLTGVMLGLKAVEDAVGSGEREQLRYLRLELQQVGQALHHVAWELRPASIDELGLASALANYVTEWGVQYGIEANFDCEDADIDRLPDEIATTMYRVVQESLTNVVKHARYVTRVGVVVERRDGEVCLAVEDDGCGFEATDSEKMAGGRNGGLGLAGMRERLMLIGAEFDVESSVGCGTIVLATIPLGLKEAAE